MTGDGEVLPPNRRGEMRSAVRLAWLSIAYLTSCIILIYLVMGASQAMKTAWVEDLISMVPPVSFLISVWIGRRPPDERHPYGYFGVVSIAFLTAAVSLFIVGGYLFVDSLIKLIHQEHPSIGTVEVFGEVVWLGWLMYPVILWSAVPIIWLGRAKLPLARRLHDKTLYTDAMMNKADWLTAIAAFLGVSGIAWGWWWADAAAACVISLDIIRDGTRQLRCGVADLMDRAPRVVDDSQWDPLPARIVTEWKKLDWVSGAEIRLRERGHGFFGEGWIRPVDRRDAIARAAEAVEVARRLDWRLQSMVVQILPSGRDTIRADDQSGTFSGAGDDV